MTDKQIIKAAQGFTRGLLGKKPTKDQCFKVCAPLHTYLKLCGIPCELTEGEIAYENHQWHHYWVTLSDGRIIDPTADQFIKPNGERLKNIWVEAEPFYYMEYEDEDYTREIENALKPTTSHKPAQ